MASGSHTRSKAPRRDHERTGAAVDGDAGLRLAEIVVLEWRDVDLAARRLTVQRSDWLAHVTVPKGGRSRLLPTTQRLTSALRAARDLRSARVLCLSDGAPITRDRVIKAVRGAQRVASVADQGVHVLRHTFCSHLAMKGAPARAIQELAGHADLSTTHPPSRCALRRTRRCVIARLCNQLWPGSRPESRPRDAPSLLRSYGARERSGAMGPPRASVSGGAGDEALG